jgi:hypothetical protein
MPSYRTLLVLALAAFTVTPVLGADSEAATQPLYGISEPPVKAKRSFKLGWKTKALLGTAVAYSVVDGIFYWFLDSKLEEQDALKNNPTHSATPPSSTPSPRSAGNTSTSLQNHGYPPPGVSQLTRGTQ